VVDFAFGKPAEGRTNPTAFVRKADHSYWYSTDATAGSTYTWTKVNAPAAAVAEYLERVGGAERPAPVPLDDAARERYLGSYAFGTGALDRLEVTVGPFGLMIGRPEGTARGLSHLGDHAFHPAGAPSVRVRFEVPDDAAEPASSVTIHDPDLIVSAVRTA
jgi:hypothetical protein